MNNLTLIDKADQGSGLSLKDASQNTISTLTYLVNLDTRDCVGTESLNDAQTAYELAGGKGYISGYVTNSTGYGVGPIVATLSTVVDLKVGDQIIINGVSGNTNLNGPQKISAIDTTLSTVTLFNSAGNGNFKSGGTFVKLRDNNYPAINEYTSVIIDNEIIVKFHGSLKNIREYFIDYITIPRDLIPLTVFMPDIIDASTNLENTTYTSTETNWSTFIPQEASFMEERILGFYSSPIDIFRSYINGAFSLQNALTPSPLQLWNPPVGAWPLQPLPYPFQTVPTYQSNEFTINGFTETFHIVLSGYGLYDFNDWTSNTGVPVNDAAITSIVRKLLLLLICSVQSYNNVDYINMILNCNTTDPGNYTSPFGYGDFQRFLPGPGLGLNYQPGSTDGADPRTYGPVPFPNFIGNVWGPYEGPNARFQKFGLRDTVQDLFLNGDLQNLLGSPIIKANVPTEDFMNDPTFGLDFSIFIDVDLNSITAATNLNIKNAMRMGPNGYGTTVVRAMGSNSATPFYQKTYQSGGGQGPSSQPGAWVNNGVYGGIGTLDDSIAVGPSSSLNTVNSSDPSMSSADIQYRAGWFDSGPNNGQFISQMESYVQFTINDISDTDLVVFIEETLRDERSYSTNTRNCNASLQLPMRLNVGSTNGTLQYIDSVFSLVAGSSYWTKKFLTPKQQLTELHIKFQTYDGSLIDIEKMLQKRKSLQFLQLFSGIINDFVDTVPNLTNLNFFFLFDPFNPVLFGRMKRYIQMTLKFECYTYMLPGLIPDTIGPLRELGPFDNSGPNQSGTAYTSKVDAYNNYN